MDYSSLRPPSIHLAPLQPFPRYDFGKGARIRTSIGSFGDCSPTVGRLPYIGSSMAGSSQLFQSHGTAKPGGSQPHPFITPLFNQLVAASSVV